VIVDCRCTSGQHSSRISREGRQDTVWIVQENDDHNRTLREFSAYVVDRLTDALRVKVLSQHVIATHQQSYEVSLVLMHLRNLLSEDVASARPHSRDVTNVVGIDEPG
jgi:hypothetical protein